MTHYNDAYRLPPVGCWLVLSIGDTELRARRTSHISDKYGDNLEYETEQGESLIGRFAWRYP